MVRLLPEATSMLTVAPRCTANHGTTFAQRQRENTGVVPSTASYRSRLLEASESYLSATNGTFHERADALAVGSQVAETGYGSSCPTAVSDDCSEGTSASLSWSDLGTTCERATLGIGLPACRKTSEQMAS